MKTFSIWDRTGAEWHFLHEWNDVKHDISKRGMRVWQQVRYDGTSFGQRNGTGGGGEDMMLGVRSC